MHITRKSTTFGDLKPGDVFTLYNSTHMVVSFQSQNYCLQDNQVLSLDPQKEVEVETKTLPRKEGKGCFIYEDELYTCTSGDSQGINLSTGQMIDLPASTLVEFVDIKDVTVSPRI